MTLPMKPIRVASGTGGGTLHPIRGPVAGAAAPGRAAAAYSRPSASPARGRSGAPAPPQRPLAEKCW